MKLQQSRRVHLEMDGLTACNCALNPRIRVTFDVGFVTCGQCKIALKKIPPPLETLQDRIAEVQRGWSDERRMERAGFVRAAPMEFDDYSMSFREAFFRMVGGGGESQKDRTDADEAMSSDQPVWWEQIAHDT